MQCSLWRSVTATIMNKKNQKGEWVWFLTSSKDRAYQERSESQGQAAADRIARESGVQPLFQRVDVTDGGSIQRLADFLQHKYGGLDILVNNPGVMYQPGSPEPLSTQVRQTLGVNFWGCLNCCHHLLPLLQAEARVVNITSIYCRSTLRECAPPIRQQFIAPDLTMGQLQRMMETYQKCADLGSCHVNGWPSFAYGVSKIGVTVMSRLQQKEVDQKRQSDNILVNACCPGWCRTDLGGKAAPKSAAQGADTPVYLALLPPGTKSPRGSLLADRAVQTWT